MDGREVGRGLHATQPEHRDDTTAVGHRGGMPTKNHSTARTELGFREKSTWLVATIVVSVYGWYLVAILRRMGATEVDAIGYEGPLLAAGVALLVVTIAGHAVLGVANPDDAAGGDERDRRIGHRARSAASHVLSVGALAALALSMLEADGFWIANAIVLSLVAAELTSAGTRIVLFRSGVQS